MQVLVQDTEILIAALHDPTSTLQNGNRYTQKESARKCTENTGLIVKSCRLSQNNSEAEVVR